MEIKLVLCTHCDSFPMEHLEKLLSFAKEIENITKCSLCNRANSRLAFKLTIPIKG